MKIRDKIDSNFMYFFDQGKATELHKILGAHLIKDGYGHNVACEFLVYAPNAKLVNILGEWNNFQPWLCNMELIDDSGIWYKYLEGNFEWKRYKYEIITKNDEIKYKSDPFAFFSDLRPSTDSKIYDLEGYSWNDAKWNKTHQKTYDKPVMIYEMHLGSWRKKGPNENDFYKYNELVPILIPYLKQFGFTHVEFMPVYEHPLDGSWGYQGTGYFSPTSRYGVPKDLMYLIDKLHQNDIGVIFDWVPGHICKDAHGLYMFDGTPLYDYSDAKIRENLEWGTANLDLGKGVTRSLLYSNARYFMDYFHVDGFRVDAVSNIIYYLGNRSKGINEGGLGFLKELSLNLFAIDDRVLLIAEDSSSYPHVTGDSSKGALGFNYKWDMGWMNDTLKYFKEDPINRKHHHNKLTFSMMYFYNEQFMLPFSHDEVVHMKGALINKMPGDYWQKFANFRLLIAYMITHPGKKLLFMGDELAQFSEWAFQRELDWNLMQYPAHDSANRFVREITKFYLEEKALYELDFNPKGFKYIDANNADQSIYIYVRYANDFSDHLVIVMNATPTTYRDYRIGVPGDSDYVEVLNSDKDIYGGSNQINYGMIKIIDEEFQGMEKSISITVAPLAIMIFKMHSK